MDSNEAEIRPSSQNLLHTIPTLPRFEGQPERVGEDVPSLNTRNKTSTELKARFTP